MSLSSQFMIDFTTWRNNTILKKLPTVKTIKVATLAVPDFLALSTYDPVTKIDIVKQRAEKYFVDISNYFQSDYGLKVLGVTKPVLSADLLEYAQNEKVVKFFTNFAKLSLAQTIYETEEASLYNGDIQGNLVEDELCDITNDGGYLAKQTMMLYFIALCEMVPKILPYIYLANDFNTKVRTFMLTDAKIQEWVKATVALHKANIDNESLDGYDGYRFNELKAKLDLLQPNFLLSNDILGTYTYTTVALYSSTNLNLVHSYPIIGATILKALKRIQKNTANVNNALINTLKTKLVTDGTLESLATKLAELVVAVFENVGKDVTSDSLTSLDTATPINSQLLQTVAKGFEVYKDNANFIKFVNGFINACNANVITYTLSNYDRNLDSFDYTLLTVGECTYINKYTDNIKSVYTTHGEFLRTFMRTKQFRDPIDLSNAFLEAIPRCYNEYSAKLVKKLLPSLFILGKDYDIYSRFYDATKETQNWPLVSILLDNINPDLVKPLSIVLERTSCSSATVLYYQSHLFSSYIQRKYLRPLVIKTLSTIPQPLPIDYEADIVVVPPFDDTPDVIQAFIATIDPQYQVIYTENDTKLEVQSNDTVYNSSSDFIKESLNLLMGIPSN